MKGLSRILLVAMMLFVAVGAFGQTLVTDAEVADYWAKWSNKNGIDASRPGYVYEYKLVEQVGISSKDATEQANSNSDIGAIVLMVPTGTAEEMPAGAEYAISTDEAMGYGMLLAVMMDDQELFNKFLRVVNYFDDKDEPKLTSWIIPGLKGTDLRTTHYKNLQDTVSAFEADASYWEQDASGKWVEKKVGFGSWVEGDPTAGWKIFYEPKFVNGTDIIQGVGLTNAAGLPTIDGYAMDGELDIAYALFLAHDKWVLNGTSKYNYLSMSAERFQAIMQDYDDFGEHVSPDGSIDHFLPTGPFNYSNWKTVNPPTETYYITRPCDWMLGHFRAYYEMVGDVRTRELVGAIQEQMEHFVSTDGVGNDTGFVPDFAMFEEKVAGTEKLVPVTGTEQVKAVGETDPHLFYMNSARYAARMAMDYLTYKDEYSLEKAEAILETLATESNPFYAGRDIETGNVPSGYSWDNGVLKAALMITAGASYDTNPVGKTFFDQYIGEFKTSFGSQYPEWSEWKEWTDVNGAKHWTDITKTISKDPNKTDYFNDTWILLALTSLNGKFTRPHAYPNELAESRLDQWQLFSGSQYANLSVQGNSLVVEITSVPSSSDAFAITLGTDKFKSRPSSGFAFGFNLTRENANGATSIEARHSYPNLSGAVTQVLDEGKITSDHSNIDMHYQGVFGRGNGSVHVETDSKIEIALNSGVKVGTKFILTDLGLFDPPHDAPKFRYVGPWRSDLKYKVGDYVRFQMETYICVEAHDGSNANNPKDATNLWNLSDYTQIGSEWASGTYYYRGDLVYYQGRTYVAQVSFHSVSAPPESPAVWMLYFDPFVGYAQDWFAGAYHQAGDYVLYQGNAYICKYSHKSIASWNPEVAWTLWEKANYLFIEIDPQPWESWTPYQAGAVVIYDDVKYECVIGHTAQPGWEPNVPGAIWKLYTP